MGRTYEPALGIARLCDGTKHFVHDGDGPSVCLDASSDARAARLVVALDGRGSICIHFNASAVEARCVHALAREKRTPPTRGDRRGSQRCRRRPTLPRSLERSTIGAVGLNDRVRNGNECGPYALVASDMCDSGGSGRSD